jgi:hypothetical protein
VVETKIDGGRIMAGKENASIRTHNDDTEKARTGQTSTKLTKNMIKIFFKSHRGVFGPDITVSISTESLLPCGFGLSKTGQGFGEP